MYAISNNVGTTNHLAKLYKEFRGVNLESSCYETPEFKSLTRRLKFAIKADLPDGYELAGWNKGHFEVAGFIRRDHGGYNQFCNLAELVSSISAA